MNTLTNNITLSEHDTTLAILPWFVNGALGEEEVARVSSHISTCTVCQVEVDFLGKMFTSQRESGDIHTIAHNGLATVLERIDQDTAPKSKSESMHPRLRDTVARYFGLLEIGRWSMAVPALCVMVIVGYTAMPSVTNVDHFYGTKTASDIGGEHTSIVLALRPNADKERTAREIGKLLGDHIILMYTQEGNLLVEISPELRPQNLPEMMIRMQKNDNVTSVGFKH